MTSYGVSEQQEQPASEGGPYKGKMQNLVIDGEQLRRKR